VSLWRVAAELARADTGGALATVARTTGSTPVPVGTKMLIGPAGRLEGSVGGGCVEADVLEAALAARGHGPLIRTHHLNADIAGDLGLSCGGTVDIVVEPLSDDPAYVAALEAAAGAEQGTLTTALDWSRGPRKQFTPGPVGAAQPPAALSDDRRTLVERLLQPPRSRMLTKRSTAVWPLVCEAAGMTDTRKSKKTVGSIARNRIKVGSWSGKRSYLNPSLCGTTVTTALRRG